MKKVNTFLILLSISMLFSSACKDGENTPQPEIESGFFSEYPTKNFEMGFSTWAYAPTVASVNGTYQFIEEQSDIYSEHLDLDVPWNAWINDLTLPTSFTNEIALRRSRKLIDKKLTVSVSLLNGLRTDLANDVDGLPPAYEAINDQAIEDAYFKHLEYISLQLEPDYLILAIEANELLIHDADKWADYKLLMANIRSRIKVRFPSLAISESMTLHNLYRPDVGEPEVFIKEVVDYANSLDFVAISFYPYFKGLKTKEDFQGAFDFLNEKIIRFLCGLFKVTAQGQVIGAIIAKNRVVGQRAAKSVKIQYEELKPVITIEVGALDNTNNLQ